MKVKVLYFANARELASQRLESLTLPEGVSLEKLVEHVLELHPGLKPFGSAVRFSINRELVEDNTVVRDGDEIGVLPPVAGG
jgi:molybdopterin converting factor subunit 1